MHFTNFFDCFACSHPCAFLSSSFFCIILGGCAIQAFASDELARAVCHIWAFFLTHTSLFLFLNSFTCVCASSLLVSLSPSLPATSFSLAVLHLSCFDCMCLCERSSPRLCYLHFIRYEAVRACKHVSAIIEDAPLYIPDEAFLTKHNIHLVAAGEE